MFWVLAVDGTYSVRKTGLSKLSTPLTARRRTVLTLELALMPCEKFSTDTSASILQAMPEYSFAGPSCYRRLNERTDKGSESMSHLIYLAANLQAVPSVTA